MCVASNLTIGRRSQTYFWSEDTPLFATMNAGYFLGIAQSFSRQDTPDDPNARRSFPNGRNSTQNVADVTAALTAKAIILCLVQQVTRLKPASQRSGAACAWLVWNAAQSAELTPTSLIFDFFLPTV